MRFFTSERRKHKLPLIRSVVKKKKKKSLIVVIIIINIDISLVVSLQTARRDDIVWKTVFEKNAAKIIHDSGISRPLYLPPSPVQTTPSPCFYWIFDARPTWIKSSGTITRPTWPRWILTRRWWKTIGRTGKPEKTTRSGPVWDRRPPRARPPRLRRPRPETALRTRPARRGNRSAPSVSFKKYCRNNNATESVRFSGDFGRSIVSMVR